MKESLRAQSLRATNTGTLLRSTSNIRVIGTFIKSLNLLSSLVTFRIERAFTTPGL